MRVIKYLVAFFHGLTYEQVKLDVNVKIVCYHVTNYIQYELGQDCDL